MKYYKMEETKKIYTQADIKTLMAAAIFNPTDGRIKSAAESIYGKEQGRFYVAEQEGEILGILGVRRVDNAFVEIMHFRVAAGKTGQGIGQGLMACLKNCERVDAIIASCDETMLAFYKKLGFTCKEEEDPMTFKLTYACKLTLD